MELEILIADLASQVTIKGRKALQKLVYFCQEAGVPVSSSYRMHIYGPYSNEVAEGLRSAIDKEIIKMSNGGVGFEHGRACEGVIAQHKDDLAKHREKIENVLLRFGQFTPLKLELYATVHFIATALWEAYGEISEQQVLDEVLAAKGDKFSPDAVCRAYCHLIEWDWLPMGQAQDNGSLGGSDQQ